MWQITERHDGFLLLSYSAAFTLIFFAYFWNSTFIAVLGFILLFLSLFAAFYPGYIIRRLQIVQAKKKIRLFQGEKGALRLSLLHRGRLPVFRMRLRLVFESGIVSFSDSEKEEQRTAEAVFDLFPNKELPVSFVVYGMARGACRLQEVTIELTDWFGFTTTAYRYEGRQLLEVLVLPKPAPVYGLERISRLFFGERPFSPSYYEDPLSVIGTRNYQSGDSFRRIHWKASAKANRLKTKQLEETTERRWTIVYFHHELSQHHRSRKELERSVERLAYVCRYAAAQEIAFSLYLNVRMPGKVPVLHLPADEGRRQLTRALELIARIRFSQIVVPDRQMLGIVEQMEADVPLLFLFHPPFSHDVADIYERWRKRGKQIMTVERDAVNLMRQRKGATFG